MTSTRKQAKATPHPLHNRLVSIHNVPGCTYKTGNIVGLCTSPAGQKLVIVRYTKGCVHTLLRENVELVNDATG